MDEIMTAEDVALYLHLSKKTVYHMAKQGSLPATRVGDSVRFYRSEIDDKLKREPSDKRHILVIDDSPAVCSVIKQALESKGHVVLTFTSGAEALKCMAEIKFDRIFLDLLMPEMDGPEVLKRIRLIDAQVPVVIITGYPDSAMLNQARDQGITQVLHKPFGLSDIVAVVGG